VSGPERPPEAPPYVCPENSGFLPFKMAISLSGDSGFWVAKARALSGRRPDILILVVVEELEFLSLKVYLPLVTVSLLHFISNHCHSFIILCIQSFTNHRW
jgi:hypothetical protein